MPFLTAVARSFIPSVNEYQDTIESLGGSHLWLFDEASGSTATDEIGNWDLNTFGQRVHRRVIGGTRGEPRTYSVAFGTSATNTANLSFNTNPDRLTRLTSATGVVGGFIGMASADGNDAHLLIRHRWGFSFSYAEFLVQVNRFGEVQCLMRDVASSPAFSANWVWNSAAVTNTWKKHPGDTLISGDRFEHIQIVQRGDGTGPKLMINGGAELTPDSATYSGAADADTWWDQGDAEYTPQVLRVDLRNSGAGSRIGGVFVIPSSLTTAEMQSIYTSANRDGQITDYCEYVKECRPVFWKPPTHGGVTSSSSFDASWWLVNFHDASAFGSGTSSQLMGERWFRADLNKTDWPISELPGMKYNLNAIPGGNGTYIDDEDNNGTWTDNVTAANDWDTGTICVVYEVPNVTGGGLQFVFGAQTISGTGLLRIQHTAGNLVVVTRASSGNENQINLDIPTNGIAIGDIIMLVVNQIGTGYQVFVNGILRDGGDIGATLNGTATGAEWFHTLRTTNRWRWAIGTNPNSVSSNFLTTPIYDFWIKTGTPLSAAQVKDLWDITKGNKAQVPVPVFL